VLLAVCSFVVTVGLVEVALRVLGRPTLKSQVAAEGETIDLAALNYNDATVPRREPPGEFRALSLGDSFAYGIVQPPYTYHSVAAGLVNGAQQEPRVRLINLGEPGVSFLEYKRALEFWEGQLEHDAIVVGVYLGNDIVSIAGGYQPAARDVNGQFAQLPFAIRDGAPRIGELLHVMPLRIADYAWAWWRMKTATVQRATTDQRYNGAVMFLTDFEYVSYMTDELGSFDPERLDEMRPGYRALLELLRALSRRRAAGKPVLLVLSPSRTQIDLGWRAQLGAHVGERMEHLDYTLPGRVVTELAGRIDPEIHVVDLLAGMQCSPLAKDSLHYATDAHWSVEGNAVAGEVVGLGLARAFFPRAWESLRASPVAACAFAVPRDPGAPVAPEVVTAYAASLLAEPAAGDR